MTPGSQPPPVTTEQWGAEKFYKSGWGKDALRLPPQDFLDEEDVGSGASDDPVVLHSGIIEPVTVSKVHTFDPGFQQPPIARLAHGLDRVLFNPGVHWMRDPHSGVYNFPPYLQRLPDVREFDFGRLHPYLRSSRDTTLRGLARKYGKTFAGSSSSLTGILSHVYRLISGEKPIDTSTLSAAFDTELANFAGSLTMPVTVRLTNKEGVWMVDPETASPEEDEKHILLWMGTMLEKFLTRTPEEFMTLLRTAPPLTEPPPREAYQYSQSNKFLLRGQLDCVDPRLPGTGVFDIKTRATMLVRLDRWNMEDFAGYEITKQHGLMESFEREQYDLIRSAFLKYAFQARIGNMDGCIVAYHNTVKHMGFEYFHNDAMETLVYGKSGVGLRIFHQCVDLLEHVLEAALQIFPGQDVELLLDKAERVDRLSVFVIPIEGEPDDIRLISVNTRSLLGDVVVDKPKAILSLRDDWSLKYSISRSTFDKQRIARLYDTSVRRQISAFPRAPGMSAAEMATMWRDFSAFGRTHATPNLDTSGVVPMRFFAPTPKIASLRKIATRGHARIEEQAKKDKGNEELVHFTDPSSFKRPELHDDDVRSEARPAPTPVSDDPTAQP
ncbi:Pet127-domain-containing protein [Auricularia subglabra TFB-10046 SS5]|nr:Pet127-domain-containing protein [Auricularia subglabra TFB-10046 SS5]